MSKGIETVKELNNISKKANKEYEIKESDDSSDYESKSYISEKDVRKARGNNNEVYNDEAILK